MVLIDPDAARQLLEAIIAGLSVLGGGMACLSGYYAARSLAAGESAGALARHVNEGIGRGFTVSSPFSVIVAITMAVT